MGFNGNSQKVAPNMAFSPDGTTGWVVTLGDLVGGKDSTFQPIFMKSSNGRPPFVSAVISGRHI